MKGRNNNMPFIKSALTEESQLKSNNKNDYMDKLDKNIIEKNDISITVQNNENNLIPKKNKFNFKKIGNLIILYETEKEIKYIMGPLFPLLFLLNLSANIFIYISVYNKVPTIFKMIGSILNLIQIYLFIFTSISNPGLPSKDYEKIIYEEENKNAKNYRKCKDCKLWINTDEKTIHCRKCQICIEGYDHHCDCINICIGKNNLKNFYFLILISFLTIIYAIFLKMGFN